MKKESKSRQTMNYSAWAPAAYAASNNSLPFDPNLVIRTPGPQQAGPQQAFVVPPASPLNPHAGMYAPQQILPYPAYFQGTSGDWCCTEYPIEGVHYVPLVSPFHGFAQDASNIPTALHARSMSIPDSSRPGTATVEGTGVDFRDPRASYQAYQDRGNVNYQYFYPQPQQQFVETPRESHQVAANTYSAYQNRGGGSYQYFAPNPQSTSPKIPHSTSSARNSKDDVLTTPKQGGVEVPRENYQAIATTAKPKKRSKEQRPKLGSDNSAFTNTTESYKPPTTAQVTDNSNTVVEEEDGKTVGMLSMPTLLTFGIDAPQSLEGSAQICTETAGKISGLPSSKENDFLALNPNAADFSGVAYSRDMGDKINEMFKEIFDSEEYKNEAALETAVGTDFERSVANENKCYQHHTKEEEQQRSSETSTMSFSDYPSTFNASMGLGEASTDQQQQVYYAYTSKNTDGTIRLSILENPKDLSSTSESDQNLIILEGLPAVYELAIKESSEEPECDASNPITSVTVEEDAAAPIATNTQGTTYQSRETFEETLDSNFMLDDFAADLAALSNDFPDFPLNLDEFFNDEQLFTEVTDDIDRQLEARSSIPDNKSSATPTREETTSSSELYAPTDNVTETTGSVDVDITQHLWRAAAASSDAAESNVSSPSPETGEVPLIGSEIEVRTSIIFSDSDDSCFSFTTSFNDEHNQEMYKSCSRMSGKTYVDASTNTSPSRAQKDVGVQTCASEKSKKTPKATQKGTPTSKRKAAAPKLHQELRGRNAEFDILITEMSRFAEQARANVGTGATPGTVEESPGEKDPQKPHASIASATSIRIKPLKRLKKSKVVFEPQGHANINRDDNVAETGSSVDPDELEPPTSPRDTEDHAIMTKDFAQSCSSEDAAAAVDCNRVENIVSKTSVGVAALGEDGHRNDESHHETVESTIPDASNDAITSFEDSEGSSKNLSGDKKDTKNHVAVVQGSATAELLQAPSAEEEDTVQLPRRYNLRKRKN